MASNEETPLLSPVTSKPEQPAGAHEGPSPLFRWVMLFFICILTFGSYYVFDNPGALQNQIMSVCFLSLAQPF